MPVQKNNTLWSLKSNLIDESRGFGIKERNNFGISVEANAAL
jgi:hypothetical protein